METKFIADVGSNHNSDLCRCYQFVKTAKDIGCWGIKFQLFKAEELYHKSAKKELELAKSRELPVGFVSKIREFCDEFNIKYIMTPFSINMVHICKEHIDYFKISSSDFLRWGLINTCLDQGKDFFFISTGGAGDNEIEKMLRLITNNIALYKSPKIVVYHCVPMYPTHIADCNMLRISELCLLNIPIQYIGWSDHTTNPAAVYQATMYNIDFIEFHLDLDGTGNEYIHNHCWLPHNIQDVIHTVRDMELIKGKYFKNQEITKEIEKFRAWRADPIDGLRPMKSERKGE